jgi:hypothetical protein
MAGALTATKRVCSDTRPVDDGQPDQPNFGQAELPNGGQHDYLV